MKGVKRGPNWSDETWIRRLERGPKTLADVPVSRLTDDFCIAAMRRDFLQTIPMVPDTLWTMKVLDFAIGRTFTHPDQLPESLLDMFISKASESDLDELVRLHGLFERIPVHRQTLGMCRHGLQLNGQLLRLVRDDLRTTEILDLAVQHAQNPRWWNDPKVTSILRILRPDELTRERCLAALDACLINFADIPMAFQHAQLPWSDIIREEPFFVTFIAPEFNTEPLCWLALRLTRDTPFKGIYQRRLHLEDIPILSVRICQLAIQGSTSHEFDQIPPEYRLPEVYTPAVLLFPATIRHVPRHAVTHEMAIAAFVDNPYNWRHLPPALASDEQLLLRAIRAANGKHFYKRLLSQVNASLWTRAVIHQALVNCGVDHHWTTRMFNSNIVVDLWNMLLVREQTIPWETAIDAMIDAWNDMRLTLHNIGKIHPCMFIVEKSLTRIPINIMTERICEKLVATIPTCPVPYPEGPAYVYLRNVAFRRNLVRIAHLATDHTGCRDTCILQLNERPCKYIETVPYPDLTTTTLLICERQTPRQHDIRAQSTWLCARRTDSWWTKWWARFMHDMRRQRPNLPTLPLEVWQMIHEITLVYQTDVIWPACALDENFG